MAFKSKIKPDELKGLTEAEYIKLCQKEAIRASKYGETGVVILSDYQFACGAIGTMMILGKLSGPLLAYYKQLKKERGQEKDFAKGICYFENIDSNNPTMRIALLDGKGKPARMKKNGKRLFKKLGFETDIFKGDLGLEEETLEETEVEEIEAQVDVENDDKSIKQIIIDYKKAFALLSSNVIPLLKTKEGITEQHYQIARKLLRLSKSVQNKLAEIDEVQRLDYKEFVENVIVQEPKIIKIVANLKKLLIESTVEGDASNLGAVLEKVNSLMREIEGHEENINSIKIQIESRLKELTIAL